MCGIFIVINKKLQPLNLSKCKSALNEMQRRGPDWSFYKTPKKLKTWIEQPHGRFIIPKCI